MVGTIGIEIDAKFLDVLLGVGMNRKDDGAILRQVRSPANNVIERFAIVDVGWPVQGQQRVTRYLGFRACSVRNPP